ncbi:WSC domain-containing protein 1 [Halocaridina rubra]|uniref:WSC domain-containing protein 1 n=1 Tax=Halocaridina rubra TaxID=373956 RepID=A0AAN8XDQ3_HALRR
MAIPRAYVKVTRRYLLSTLFSLTLLFAVSSYLNHHSLHVPSSSSSYSSLFFVPVQSPRDNDLIIKNTYHHGKTETYVKNASYMHNESVNKPNRNKKTEKDYGRSRKREDMRATDKQIEIGEDDITKTVMILNTEIQIRANTDSVHESKTKSMSEIGKMKHGTKLDNNTQKQSGSLKETGLISSVIKGKQFGSTNEQKSSIYENHPGRQTSGPFASETNSSWTRKPISVYKYRYKDIINPSRKSKYSWQNDIDCNKFKVHFANNGALPIRALASYPGSGNTWTRRLLEDASGIFTGSIYSDQQLFVNGYYGELEPWTSGTTIAQKTHDCGFTHVQAFNKSVILLLRNPYRAILSFHNYLFAGHTGFAPMSNYRRKDWSKFVHLQVKSWLEMAINWTTQSNPRSLTVLHYEYLQENPVPYLEHTLRNLGIEPDPERMQCLQKAHSYKTFKRKEEFVPEKLEMFSTNDKDKIDRAIRYIDYLLRKRGQQSLPVHLYEFYNGTAATHVTKVHCNDDETSAQCDHRVDMMNTIRKRDPYYDEERHKRRRHRDRRETA